MVFDVAQSFGGDEAVSTAADYPGIRLFTVGRRAVQSPQQQLVSVLQPWSVASPDSVRFDGGNFTAFSAVAWYAAASLYTSLGGEIPVGVIVSAYSGTPIQYWVSPDAAKQCPYTAPVTNGNYSQLANGMILPLTVGPMALSPRVGFWWYQGEQNLGQDAYYTCQLPALIADWRSKFALPQTSAFVVVGLAAWPSSGDHYDNLPLMRAAQIAALSNPAVPSVGYAAAYDCGDVESPWPGHPRLKAPVGQRVAATSLGLGFDWSTQYTGPIYESASVERSPDGSSVTVSVLFTEVSIGDAPIILNVSKSCPPAVPAPMCEGLAVQTTDGVWHADSELAIDRTPDGMGLALTLPLAPGLTVNATRGMWANWPLAYVTSAFLFPAVPWNEPL